MDRPVAYRGGPQMIFRRAESASFFGREIGLMYTHAHLRYAEAMSALGDSGTLFDALDIVNPISIGDRMSQALPRQRNAFFSSSDADFPDRASASAQWDRVKAGTIGFEGGWRIYSSGPGIFTSLLIRCGFGGRRLWGAPRATGGPCRRNDDVGSRRGSATGAGAFKGTLMPTRSR